MAPRRKRRNHSPPFKTKVAVEALKEDQTVAQLAQRFDARPNQVTAWKRQLLEGVVDVFESGPKQSDDSDHPAVRTVGGWPPPTSTISQYP